MAIPAAFAMVMAVLLGIIRTPVGPNTPPEKLFLFMLPAVLALIVFAVVYMVVYMYALGATTVAVSELYLGRDTTVGAAYGRVRLMGVRLILLIVWTFLSIFGACLVVGAVSVGLALFLTLISRVLAFLVVPLAVLGVFAVVVLMSVRFGVSVPALVIENVPAGTALKRSIELTRENVGRVFLIVLCATVIAYATALVFQGPFSIAALVAGPATKTALLLNIAGAVSGAIGGMISGPVMIIGLAMMYYDLRIRKEALDLELLLANLDSPRAS
jgi:hypothetical protein